MTRLAGKLLRSFLVSLVSPLSLESDHLPGLFHSVLIHMSNFHEDTVYTLAVSDKFLPSFP